MKRPIWLVALVASVAMFAWGAISHMLLPWHEATINTFRDEDLVAEVLMTEAPHSGIYIAPMAGMMEKGISSDEKERRMQEAWDKGAKGPNVFLSVHREGKSGMATPMILQFIAVFISALMVLWLLQVTNLTTGGKILFVMIAGMTGTLLLQLEQWVWWSFSTSYVLVNVVDCTIRWAIGGLVIAKFGTVKEANPIIRR